MVKRITVLVAVSALALSIAYGGSGKLDKKSRDLIAIEHPDESHVKFAPLPAPDPSTLSLVGTSTTITGFWDFQVNGGACEMIRVNQASGNIHVIMMVADDSASQSPSRR